MGQVGIRELKQNASVVVARAEQGESIDITLRGRPVARITPIETGRRVWVPAQALADTFASLQPDRTGWLDEHHRSRDDDPVVDPWEEPAR